MRDVCYFVLVKPKLVHKQDGLMGQKYQYCFHPDLKFDKIILDKRI